MPILPPSYHFVGLLKTKSRFPVPEDCAGVPFAIGSWLPAQDDMKSAKERELNQLIASVMCF